MALLWNAEDDYEEGDEMPALLDSEDDYEKGDERPSLIDAMTTLDLDRVLPTGLSVYRDDIARMPVAMTLPASHSFLLFFWPFLLFSCVIVLCFFCVCCCGVWCYLYFPCLHIAPIIIYQTNPYPIQ